MIRGGVRATVTSILCLQLVSASGVGSPQSHQWKNTGLSDVEGTWEYPGHEAKVMRMVFEPGGTLTFTEGFEFHNPATWAYNSELEELRLTITVPEQYDLTVLRFQLKTGGIKKFDAEKSQIHYSFPRGTKRLDFSGWIFFKK